MHTQTWRPIALYLGVGAGTLMLAGVGASPAYAWTVDDPAAVSASTAGSTVQIALTVPD